MTDSRALTSVQSDAELILSTRAGDSDAYGQLYRRHVDSALAAATALARSRSEADDIVAEAFSRVLGVLQRGSGPDVSFRPYLLTAVRNAFYDRARKARREEPTDEIDDTVNVSLLEAAASEDDRAMVAMAFATLPERWQLVLWHTEVEGHSPAEVGPLLGLAPNAVAALAYRAREGLRTAYLQSHLQKPLPTTCQECAANLGAYVRDGLSTRERRRVDEHLETCDSCPALLIELHEANVHLRAVLIPIIVGVSASKYLAALGAGKGVVGVIHHVRHAASSKPVATGAIAASILAVAAMLTFAGGGKQPSTAATATTVGRAIVTAVPDATVGDVTVPTGTTIAPAVEPLPVSTATSSSTATQSSASTNASTNASAAASTSALTTPTTQKKKSTPTTPTTRPRSTTTQPATTLDTPSTPLSLPVVPVITPDTTPSVPSASSTSTAEPTTTILLPPAAPQLAVGAELVAPGIANFSSIVRVDIANGAGLGGGTARPIVAGPAVQVTMSMPLPAGVGFLSNSNSNWQCGATSAELDCTTASMAAGSRDSLDLTLSVGASSFTLTPTVRANGTASVTADHPLTVPVTPVAGAITADYDRGSIVVGGNSSMTCDTTGDPTCAPARNGVITTSNNDLNRQSHVMTNVNSQTTADSDAHVPFNSSTATISLGAGTVRRAYLMWGGDTAGSTSITSPSPADRGTVRFTTPDGQFHDIVASNVSVYGDSTRYTAYLDVTSLVQANGSGSYQVADIQAAADIGTFGGWSLVIVTHDPAAPMRLLAVLAPDATMSSGHDYDVTIPLGPRSTARAVTLDTVTFEGDLGWMTEVLSANGSALSSATSPASNPFNSSILGATNPVFVNNFGVDVDSYDTTVAGATLAINATSTQDLVQLGMFALSSDL